jgi:16S rRNA C1402 N4-methylase RsmH
LLALQGEDRIVKHTFKNFAAASKEALRQTERGHRRQQQQQQQRQQQEQGQGQERGQGGQEAAAAAAAAAVITTEAPKGHYFEVPREYKRPVLPTAQEVAENPRSRSAKLRVLQRVLPPPPP